MASGVGGDAGEGDWLKVAELRAMTEAQDPHVKSHLGGDVKNLVGVVCFSRISSGGGGLRIVKELHQRFILHLRLRDGCVLLNLFGDFSSATNNVSLAQKEASAATRHRHGLEVEDEGHLKDLVEVDNITLRRFLRARNQDVGKASVMLLKFVAWRREAVPGGVMPAERVRGELSDDKVRMGGLDRGGRPVVFAFPAKHFSAKRDIDEHKRFIIYLLDKICARMPRGQEKFMCIVDLKGWGYANSDVRAYIATIEIMQNYYPERLGKALMIHVPYIFMKAWKAVYPFIDTNTRAKFVFVDDKSLDETLRREMEESQIPEMYGGTLPLVPLSDD